jgi:hypothetical protein
MLAELCGCDCGNRVEEVVDRLALFARLREIENNRDRELATIDAEIKKTERPLRDLKLRFDTSVAEYSRLCAKRDLVSAGGTADANKVRRELRDSMPREVRELIDEIYRRRGDFQNYSFVRSRQHGRQIVRCDNWICKAMETFSTLREQAEQLAYIDGDLTARITKIRAAIPRPEESQYE